MARRAARAARRRRPPRQRPPWAADLLPYLTNRVAAALLVTGDIVAPGPVLATAAATIALAAAAMWRFARQEL